MKCPECRGPLNHVIQHSREFEREGYRCPKCGYARWLVNKPVIPLPHEEDTEDWPEGPPAERVEKVLRNARKFRDRRSGGD